MTNALQAALYSIPADDREVWWRMGAAIKSELGEAGFSLWDAWSRQSYRYREASARATWRALRPTGRDGRAITVGSLYHLAKENGWLGEAPARHQPSAEERRLWAEARRREEAERNRREADAAAKAERMIMEAEYVDPRARRARNRQSDEVPSAHPYLVAKGFAQQDSWACVGRQPVGAHAPLSQAYDASTKSVQTIGPDGSKKNLPWAARPARAVPTSWVGPGPAGMPRGTPPGYRCRRPSGGCPGKTRWWSASRRGTWPTSRRQRVRLRERST